MTAQILYLPSRCRFLVVNETSGVRDLLRSEPLALPDGSGGFWIDPDQLGPLVARLAERGVSLTIGAISPAQDEPEPPPIRPRVAVKPGFTFVYFDGSGASCPALVHAPLADPTRSGQWWEVVLDNGYVIPVSHEGILADVERAWRKGLSPDGAPHDR